MFIINTGIAVQNKKDIVAGITFRNHLCSLHVLQYKAILIACNHIPPPAYSFGLISVVGDIVLYFWNLERLWLP